MGDAAELFLLALSFGITQARMWLLLEKQPGEPEMQPLTSRFWKKKPGWAAGDSTYLQTSPKDKR